MAYFRLHRRLKLLPGVRINLAKTGPSISLGTNGAMVNVGRLGVRTTVGLPGSGMSVINRTSWHSMSGNDPKTQPVAATAASVDAALDGMSHRKRREFFIKMVAESSLGDVKAQRQAFEVQLTERVAEIDEIDRIDASDIRQIYADAIAAKENATSRAITIPLVLVVFGGLGMWAGIANGNGWVSLRRSATVSPTRPRIGGMVSSRSRGACRGWRDELQNLLSYSQNLSLVGKHARETVSARHEGHPCRLAGLP